MQMKISKYDREKVSRVRGREVQVTFEHRPGGNEAVSHVCISVGEECRQKTAAQLVAEVKCTR